MEATKRRERRREDGHGSHHHRHSRENNNYDFDFNDISRASTPTSQFSSRSEGRKKEREHKYSVDDYKRKIARLKSELDLEKAKSKKAHKEKSSELREMRDSYEVRKQVEIDELEDKMKRKLEKEKKQLEENLKNSIMEEKDRELQDVLKFKEEELRELKKKFKQEKDSALRLAIDNEKRIMTDKEREMVDEIEKLKQDRDKMEQQYKKKLAEEAKKEKEFAKVKDEYEGEMKRILSDSKKLAMGNLEKLRKAEKALSEHAGESDDELDEMEFNDLLADLQMMQSQASSRAVSRSVSTTSELKFDEINAHINNLLSSPAVTPGPSGQGHMTPSMQGHITPGIQGQGYMEGPSPLTLKGVNGESKRSSSAMSEPARDLFNRKQEERDRQLQKKVSELQTQTQRLERKIALLKTENETLKRKQDDKKPLEEKIKTLKKRNAELAAIARRLEEKAKHLQQENVKKAKEMAAASQGAGQVGVHSQDQMKKLFARQRAKDLSEHAKQMLSKDREIEDLRKKCQELADSLSNADFLGPENCEMYEEKEELVAIIKHAAKERLSMERQLAIARPGQDSKVVSSERYRELEDTNEVLKQEIAKLERAQSDTERLEIELTQKKLECERLNREVDEERVKSKNLEGKLVTSQREQTQLTNQVTGLQTRLVELEKVNEECSTLRLSLSDAQHECEVAKSEVSVLQLKVQNLETVVQNLEFSTEKLKQVEKDYHDTVQKLQSKQQEIDHLQKIQESARDKYETAITSLQNKIHGLETQCEQQSLKQQELNEEITKLQTQAVTKSRNISSAEIQTGRSLEFAPSSTSSPNQSPRASPVVVNGTLQKSPSPVTPSKSSQLKSQTPSKSPAIKSPITKPVSPAHSTPIASKAHNSAKNSHSSEVLASQITPILQSATRKSNHGQEHSESTKSAGTDTGYADDDDVNQTSNLSPDLDKGEFEDPELLAIAEKLKELEIQSDSDESSKSDKGDDSGMESRGDQRVEREASEISVLESRLSVLAKKGPIQVYIAKYSYDPYKYSPNENPEAELPLKSLDYVLIYGEMDEDGFFDGELLDGRRGLVPSNFIEKVAEEDMGDFHAAMANAGHEDDSTAANSVAVPDLDSSDDLEKPDDLEQDSQLRGDITSDLDNIDEEDENNFISSHRQSKDLIHTGAPFPRNLQLDRQLASSILVSWQPPDNVDLADIRSYHVFLDGDFKMLVRGNERTKALLENVESRKIHRVSVRCISSQGQSHDNQCTILVGKGLSPATSHTVKIQAKDMAGRFDNNVRADKLTSTVEFTTDMGGAPEPPVNVQVESGPKDGSILLTWLPVTIDIAGFSNGALVAGYSVYADGKKVKHISGATNDHSILALDDFAGQAPKELYVVTVTQGKIESEMSEVVRLPANLVQELTNGAAKPFSDSPSRTHEKSPINTQDPLEKIDQAFDKLNQVYEQQPISLQPTTTNFQEPFYDSSCSELSDIPEVEEPSSPESANENPPLKDTLKSLVNGISNLSNDSLDFEEIYQRNLTQEQIAENSGTKSPLATSQATPKKSQPKGETGPTQQMLPQIEITQESSVARDHKEYSATNDKVFAKSDSKGSSKSPNHETKTVKDKYSSHMDNRDGYRENVNSRTHGDDYDITDRGSLDRISASQSEPHSDHRHTKSVSPSRNSNSPRAQESPRTRESPRERQDHSPQDRRKDGVSPRSKGRQSAKSPVPSPSQSKSNKPSSGYQGETETLELSKISSIEKEGDISNFPESDDDSITGEINPPVDDSRIRLFVALFDYDPESMSPNQDSLEEELPFREGQIIKIYGDKDADGFYRGECAGRIGYIPCNMVSEIQVDDPELEEQLMREVQENGSLANSAISEQLSTSDKYLKPITSNGVHLSPTDMPAAVGEVTVRRTIAMYDYDPQELSPNVDAEVELSFKAGDIIICYGEMDDDGFFMGDINGRRGLVPSNFLQETGASDEEALDSVSVVTPARSGESINTSDSRKSEQSEKNDSKQHYPQQQQQQQHQSARASPGTGDSPTGVANTGLDQVTEDIDDDFGMSRPRSLTPDELKQKKKSGGFFSKGKNIFKKFTR
ncbi:peripheral-type benzodiazepine receptor-associated protein 1-like isoform X4 [Mya arenaria]|uniref:peripheral-type benzodiazepine receptor-associated protein 1-like isoform X4 n=1 Tax=Mya arenaria TaxID=6604 RepID=UPI0022E92176|nr:peripheral-type benzodiazepine receptor-associated protein 1-like isoform X4 [Mya arenaria]